MTPDTDPLTLLAAIVLIFSVASLSWWGMARALRSARQASLCLAAANALLAGALVLHTLRGIGPPLLAFWGSDAMSIAGLVLLRAAVPAIARRPPAWRSGLAVWLPAVLLLAAIPYVGDLRWHARIAFLSLTLLTLMAGVDAWRQLRERVTGPLASLLAGPLFVASLLLAARLVESLLAPGQTPDFLVKSEFNIAFLWSTLAMNLLLNATIAFLVLMTLILHIQRLTQRDPLTDVLNRRALSEAIEAEHLRLQRGHPYALVMIDMDHFKQLNDRLGHAAGDAALQRLVQVLAPCVREVDRLGRLGGEEFCVLLPLTGLAGAALVAERMRANLEGSAFEWQGQHWPLTASFGVAEAASTDVSADAVLSRADQGMYKAKAQGRNLVQASEG